MTAQSDIEALNKAQEVSEARVMHTLLDRADSVLDNLVSSCVSGTLTDRNAAVGIYLITELRREAAKAQRTVQQGIRAGETLNRSRT